jgi:hypothetical protein
MIAIRVSGADAACAPARSLERTSNLTADLAERPRAASLSDREERILALEELRSMGILHRNEFVAEIKAVTDPQPRLDPVSPELPGSSSTQARCANTLGLARPDHRRVTGERRVRSTG